MTSIESLLDRIIGFSLLYVQSGNFRHYARAQEAKSSLLNLLDKPSAEVKVVKVRNGIPSVIEFQGDRFTFDAGSTFRGGVRRGIKARKT